MTTAKCPVCDWEIKDGGVKVTVGGKKRSDRALPRIHVDQERKAILIRVIRG